MKQANPYPLRLEETLYRKIKTLSQESNRSFNREVEYELRKYVEQYEAEHGEIPLAD